MYRWQKKILMSLAISLISGGAIITINPTQSVFARGGHGGGHGGGGHFGGGHFGGHIGHLFGGGGEDGGGTSHFHSHSTFSDDDDTGTTHSTGSHGSDEVSLGGSSTHTYKFKTHVDGTSYTNKGFRYDSGEPVSVNGFYRSKTYGDALTTKQQAEYAEDGSHSYWSPYHVYYPGTAGYFNHPNYYSNDQHSTSQMQNYAELLVINDYAKLLSPQVTKMFINQDLAYQQTELKPRIFIQTNDFDGDNIQDLFNSSMPDLSYNDRAANNKNGMLILVIHDPGIKNVVGVKLDSGLTKDIKQNDVDKLVQKYQSDINSNNKTVMNNGIVRLNHALTKLLWTQYLQKHLTNVSQNNQGVKVKSSNNRWPFLSGFFLFAISALALLLAVNMIKRARE